MSDDSSAKWSDVDIHVEQNQGAVYMDMYGDANLIVRSPTRSFEQIDPYVPLTAHHPDTIGDREEDCEQSARVNLSLPPETARELGEWLIEHADDEPETVLKEGDRDE